MITLGEMQISGMLTMLMLSVMLLACVPDRSIRRGSFARARWMMAAGTGLIAVQFLLQYIFGFRQMGVTQGVCCNLVFFTIAYSTISLYSYGISKDVERVEEAEEVVNQEIRPREIDPAITEAVDRWKANEYFHRTFRQMTGMTPANFQ